MEGTGDYYATQACIDEYKLRCGSRYREEFIPGSPGCLDDEYSSGYGTFNLNLAELGVLGKPWVGDGVTQENVGALRSLDGIVQTWANRNRLEGRWGEGAITMRIADMPFLETLEPDDEGALRGLAAVVRPESRFRAVMSHPLLSGGITDEMTGVIASLRQVVLGRRPDGSRFSEAEIMQRLIALLDSTNR